MPIKNKEELYVLRYPFKITSEFAREAKKDPDLNGCILVSDDKKYREIEKWAFFIDVSKTCHLTKTMYEKLVRSSNTIHKHILGKHDIKSVKNLINEMTDAQKKEVIKECGLYRNAYVGNKTRIAPLTIGCIECAMVEFNEKDKLLLAATNEDIDPENQLYMRTNETRFDIDTFLAFVNDHWDEEISINGIIEMANEILISFELKLIITKNDSVCLTLI